MNVDTRDGWIAIIATIALAVVVCVSAVGIVVLAVVHDGQLASQAMDAFKQVLIGSGFFGTVLAGISGVTRAQTAKIAIANGASVQGSPISVTTTTPSPIGASSPSGISLPVGSASSDPADAADPADADTADGGAI